MCDELLTVFGGALLRDVGKHAMGKQLERKLMAKAARRGEGRSWQGKKMKFKVDELFAAANNPGLTCSHSEHPKLRSAAFLTSPQRAE